MYVAMAGLHGCIPNCVELFEHYDSAVEFLIDLHGLGERRRVELQRDGYLELSLNRHGNEYCEITESDAE